MVSNSKKNKKKKNTSNKINSSNVTVHNKSPTNYNIYKTDTETLTIPDVVEIEQSKDDTQHNEISPSNITLSGHELENIEIFDKSDSIKNNDSDNIDSSNVYLQEKNISNNNIMNDIEEKNNQIENDIIEITPKENLQNIIEEQNKTIEDLNNLLVEKNNEIEELQNKINVMAEQNKKNQLLMLVNKLQKEKKNVTFSEDVSEPEIVIINTTPANTIEINNSISEMEIEKKKKLSKQRRKNGLF